MTKYKFLALLIIFLLTAPVAHAANLRFDIQGLKDDMLKNVESRLAINKQLYGKNLNENEIQTLFHNASQEIRNALAPYGYFRPRITSQLIPGRKEWVARFRVSTGPAMHIGSVELEITGPGKDNHALQKYAHHFPLHVGAVLKTPEYEKAKEELFQIANSQGYIKAVLTQSSILVNVDQNRARIVMHFDTGPLYYFGAINVEKNAYSPTFLRRFIPFKSGEPFSSQKLIEFQQELANSYYFQQVMVTPDFNNIDQNSVPIRINVTPPKSQKYSIGVGYGTLTQFRLTMGVSLRRLTDTGQHFDAQLKLSSVLSGVAGKYYIPGRNPLTDQWVIGANYQKFSPQSGNSRSQTVSAGYQKKDKHTQTNLNLNYLNEHYSIKPKPTRRSQLLYPSMNWSYVEVDDLINPRTGKSINILLQGASQAVLSSTSFLQTEVKAKYLFSPFSFGRFILRGDVGYTLVHDLNDLPLSMRFFAGGTNSIRGYKDSSIGPGKYLFVGSLEYQNHIKGNWTGAIFYDFGNATDHISSSLKKSQGIGLVYESVIGPIKFYVARAQDKPHGKNPYGFEFSIGPEF